MTIRVLVIGATGTQGNAVARHLLSRGRFAVRALTRRPHASLAGALKASGAEIVEGDLRSRASLRAALRGCQVVFGLASRHEWRDRRDVLGLNLVNAVAGSAVDHFVLSDRHGHLERYATSLQLPATYVRPGLYFERIDEALGHSLGMARSLVAVFGDGDARVPAVAGDDIGGLVARLLERPAEFMDRRIAATGDCQSPRAYAAALARWMNRDTGPRAVSPSEPRAGEVERLWDRCTTSADVLSPDVSVARAIYPEIKDFDTWLGTRGPAALQATAEDRRRSLGLSDNPSCV